MKAFIVIASKDCQRAANADRIAQALGVSKVKIAWRPLESLEDDTLHFTSWAYFGRTGTPAGVEVLTFEAAMVRVTKQEGSK